MLGRVVSYSSGWTVSITFLAVRGQGSNTPPAISRLPYFKQLPYSALAGSADADVTQWNKALNSGAASFESKHPDSSILFMDTKSVFNPILDHPTEYGAPDNTCHNHDGTSCLWFDTIHPGQAIQSAVAHAADSHVRTLGFY